MVVEEQRGDREGKESGEGEPAVSAGHEGGGQSAAEGQGADGLDRTRLARLNLHLGRPLEPAIEAGDHAIEMEAAGLDRRASCTSLGHRAILRAKLNL
jgi:hypothetical protein